MRFRGYHCLLCYRVSQLQSVCLSVWLVYSAHAGIATRATQMVERLSEENRSLRQELKDYYKKVSKLEKVPVHVIGEIVSTAFFIMSTLLCSLSSWLTSSYVYHLITVITLVLTICHSLESRPFTPDLKLISFTNPSLHSHSYSFRTAFTVLNLYCIKGALALFVLVSFSGYVC